MRMKIRVEIAAISKNLQQPLFLDEEDYLYLPDDEDEAYRKAMEDVERRYAVNNEMFVGENYACRKCHLVLGGTDKEESELENQIILAKEHVLNEHLVFRR